MRRDKTKKRGWRVNSALLTKYANQPRRVGPGVESVTLCASPKLLFRNEVGGLSTSYLFEVGTLLSSSSRFFFVGIIVALLARRNSGAGRQCRNIDIVFPPDIQNI